MKIVGCDFHPCWQQVAVFDVETGEINERKLMNGDGEAERFYGDLPVPSLIGIEACGNSQWFIELLEPVGADGRAAGSAAAADASAQAGGDSLAGEERVTASGAEPWGSEAEGPVDSRWDGRLEKPSLKGMEFATAPGFAGAAERTGRAGG